MFRCIAVQQSRIEHQVSQFWHQLGEYGVHVGFYDKVIVEWLYVILLLFAVTLTTLLEILLRLFGCNNRCQVAFVICLQFLLDVNRQEGLAGENLRAGAFKVVINEFHLIYLSLCELATKLHRYLDTLLYVGVIGQSRVLSLHLQSHLACFLVNLTAYGIDFHIVSSDSL